MSQTDTRISPRLDALLSGLRARLLRQVYLHGLGSFAAVLAGWLLFAFLADWILHVPKFVRILHGVGLIALPLYFLRKELLQLLKKVPGKTGMAVLIERANPNLRELLVSAVQLGAAKSRGEIHGDSAELVDSVVADAEAATNTLDLNSVLDGSRPRRRFLMGLGISLICAGVLITNGQASGIFFQRLVGANVAWPRRTSLRIEIPAAGEQTQIVESPDLIEVRLARGSDLPILVHVDGVIPAEVELHFIGGHSRLLQSGGTSLLRDRLPSVQEDLEFYVTGGDDQRGTPRVRLTVLQPPDVSGLAVHVIPPAYSGIPESIIYDREVEVLQGSQLIVHMLPDPADVTGLARLLPEDREVPLTAAPYPLPQEASATDTEEGALPDAPSPALTSPALTSHAPTSPGLVFELTADASLRYRFELRDATGLPNPDPGLYGIQVIEDRRPEVLVLSPGRVEVDVIQGGALSLRARVRDDFGIAGLRWSVRRDQEDALELAGGELDRRPLEVSADPYSASKRGVEIARTRLEIDDLGGGTPLAEGSSLILQVEATDNREPVANKSPSAPVRLRVVSAEEFQRRLQDRLARAGEQVHHLLELEEDKLNRCRELLGALSGDVLPDDGGEEFDIARDSLSALANLLSGQRRVQGDSRALTRELASIAESVIYARLDDRADPLLEALDAGLSAGTDRGFQVEPWLDVTRRYDDGQLGSAELAGKLVQIVSRALAISEEHSEAAAEALSAATALEDASAMLASVQTSLAAQVKAKEKTEELIAELAGWDNFQSILGLARDILNGQKNLLERTRQYEKDQ